MVRQNVQTAPLNSIYVFLLDINPHNGLHSFHLLKLLITIQLTHLLVFSPYYLVYQRNMNLPLDFAVSDIHTKNAALEQLLNDRQQTLRLAREQLAKTVTSMEKHNTHKTLPSPFHVNDQVLVHKTAFRTNYDIRDINKFDDRWFGPFTILKVINRNAFQLDLPSSSRKHNVINISFLRPYKLSTSFPRTHPDFLLPPSTDFIDSSADSSIYEIESILKSRLRRSHPQWQPRLTQSQQLAISDNQHDFEFLIKWKGYPMSDNTWEPFTNIITAPETLNDHIQQKKTSTSLVTIISSTLRTMCFFAPGGCYVYICMMVLYIIL